MLTPRSCVVKTAMEPVRRNHCQIRRAKAEPADGYSAVMYQLKIASTYSEQEQERQPPNADSTGETMPSTPGIESEDTLAATIGCGPRRSQVSADCLQDSGTKISLDYYSIPPATQANHELKADKRLIFSSARILKGCKNTLRKSATIVYLSFAFSLYAGAGGIH